MPATTTTPLTPDLENKLGEWFPHWWDFIEADVPKGEKRPQWRTEKDFRLNPRTLVRRWSDPETLIGLRFSSQTHYGLLDIDPTSPYHPDQDPDALRAICHSLEDIGINKTVLIQSSYRGGLHLYIFLPEVVSTWALACVLRQQLQKQFQIKDGTLEIFPNTKAYSRQGISLYKGHRLPLQVGSYVLDKDFMPYTDSLETFFALAQSCAEQQDMDILKKAMKRARKGFRSRTRGRMKEWRIDLLTTIEQGWTAFGQTNMILGYISEYGVVFEGIEDEEQLADYITQTALGLPRINEFCQHLLELPRRAREWARCTLSKRFWCKAVNHPKDRQGTYKELEAAVINAGNLRREIEARAKIQRVVADLEAKGELPDEITPRQRAIIAAAKESTGSGLSKATLYKKENLCFWHPNHLKEESTPIAPSTGCIGQENGSVEGAVMTEAQEVQAQDPNEGFLSLPMSFSYESGEDLGETTSSNADGELFSLESSFNHFYAEDYLDLEEREDEEEWFLAEDYARLEEQEEELVNEQWFVAEDHADLEGEEGEEEWFTLEEEGEEEIVATSFGEELVDPEWLACEQCVDFSEQVPEEEEKPAEHIADWDEEAFSRFHLIGTRLKLKSQARKMVDLHFRLFRKRLTLEEKRPYYLEAEMQLYFDSGIPELVKEAEDYFSGVESIF